MFAVIQNQQQVFVLQSLRQRVQQRTACLLLYFQRDGNGLRRQGRVGKRSQFHQPYAIRVLFQYLGSHLQREPGFARSPRCP